MLRRTTVASLKDPSKAGWMSKQGHFFKTWKKRWFVLKDKKLWYFATQTANSPKGVVLLDGYYIDIVDDPVLMKKAKRDKDEGVVMFSLIHTIKPVYTIVAPDEEEMKDWIQHILLEMYREKTVQVVLPDLGPEGYESPSRTGSRIGVTFHEVRRSEQYEMSDLPPEIFIPQADETAPEPPPRNVDRRSTLKALPDLPPPKSSAASASEASVPSSPSVTPSSSLSTTPSSPASSPFSTPSSTPPSNPSSLSESSTRRPSFSVSPATGGIGDKICPRCKNKVTVTAKYCGKCGEKQTITDSPATSTRASASPYAIKASPTTVAASPALKTKTFSSEELALKRAEERRLKDEEDRKKKEEEKMQREAQFKKEKEEEQRRRKEQLENDKSKSEDDKKRKEEEERRKREADEKQRREEEDKKKREAEQKRKEEEEKRKREAEQKRKEEEEKKRKEEERRNEEDKKRRATEADIERKRKEEERVKKEAEEKKKREEEDKREQVRRQTIAAEDEKRRKEEEKRKEEERKRVEEEKRKKEEEDRKKKQAEEEKRKKEDEEKKRKDEEQKRKLAEEEKKKREDEEKKRKDEEQKRKLAEEEKKKREDEEKKRKDEEQKRKLAEEEKKRREEEERKKRIAEEDKKKKEEEERKKKQEEEDKRKREEEKRKRDAEAEAAINRVAGAQAATPQTKINPPCAKCNKPLSGTTMQALGKEYHASCFDCGNCSKVISGRFAVIGNKTLCEPCALESVKNKKAAAGGSAIGGSQPKGAPGMGSTSKKCFKCQQPLSGAVIQAIGQEFHERCFGCFDCGKKLTASCLNVGGKALCDQCGKKNFITAQKQTKEQQQQESKNGMTGLLQWCKNRTAGYPGVEVTNFIRSWQDGLAYCALLHSYRPDLIDFKSLKKENKEYNINLAFDVARKLNIEQLLDPEDFALEKLSMMTYLSQAYLTLKKLE
eukprot:TRINITY_DN951_c0_g1_i1.p1 TRINITY_DN951_c0_g1~~TRINITY_DN951_c0_g1_i1.p1  ORF type:complete len:947 (-),score=412.22 TRINITY_DN951_c0_g1_i1:93-2933(-)